MVEKQSFTTTCFHIDVNGIKNIERHFEVVDRVLFLVITRGRYKIVILYEIMFVKLSQHSIKMKFHIKRGIIDS